MSEKKYSDYGFGFENYHEFSDTVQKYLEKERAGQMQSLDWIEALDEHAKEVALSAVESSRKSFDMLERAVDDLPGLYLFVKGIYDELVKLEQDPKLVCLSAEDRDLALAGKFLDRYEQIKPVTGLVEHGIGQKWGYDFVQALVHRVWLGDE